MYDLIFSPWFFLQGEENENVSPTIAEVPEIKRAFDVAQQSRLSREELEILEKREMFLHNSRLDIETICQTTGLSIAEIEQLR